MYATNPGRYRQRVTIQQQTEMRDPVLGSVTVVWATLIDNVPAEVLTGPGRELVAADAQQAEAAARIQMRWFPGLTAKMRILWDGRVFNIAGPPDTDSTGRREWRCVVTAGVNDGR